MRSSRLVLLALGLFSAASAHASYNVVSSSTDAAFSSPFTKTDTVVQDGSDSRNRFTMHHVAHSTATHKGSILLLPSLLLNFNQYTMDGNNVVTNSMAATLSAAGFDVWGISYRHSMIPANGCSLGGWGCSVMASWGMATYLQDIAYVRAAMESANPGEKPAVGGLSMGAMVGIAVVDANPSDYGGLLMWEGMLYSANSTITTLNAANCATDQAQIALGVYFNEGLPTAARLAVTGGVLTSVALFGTPDPIFGTPTFLVDTPNLLHTNFKYVNFNRMSNMTLGGNYVESNPMFRDIHCSFAGDRTFTSNLANWTGPVLAIEGGKSYGPYMQDTIDLMGSTDIEVHSMSDFGHADHYLSANHSTYVETPVLNWLDNTVFP